MRIELFEHLKCKIFLARSSFRCVTFHFGRSCETQTKGKKHFERIFLHCNLIQPVHSATESFGIGNNTIATWINHAVDTMQCTYTVHVSRFFKLWLILSDLWWVIIITRSLCTVKSMAMKVTVLFGCATTRHTDQTVEPNGFFWRKKKPYSFRKVSLDSKNFNFWWRIWNLHNSLFFSLWKRTFT